MDDFLTLQDLKDSDIPSTVGICSSEDRFVTKLNSAVRRLMTRGDWTQTIVPVHMCVRKGCVTFPRFVKDVRKMNICGQPIQMSNLYCDYLPRDNWPCWYNFQLVNTWSTYRQTCQNWGMCGASQAGRYSTYADPQGDRYIRAYPQFPEDVGKTVTIFGKDTNGQPLVHKDSDGNYLPGHVITIAAPYGSSSIEIQTPIDRVIKDTTAGQIFLYAYNATDDELEDLAVYAPDETRPSYARYRIPGCKDSAGVMAMVKLKFVPVVNATDLVLIPSLDAIRYMMQSANLDDATDPGGADTYEAKAIRELNLQLRDEMPENKTAVNIDPFNASGVGPQQCF